MVAVIVQGAQSRDARGVAHHLPGRAVSKDTLVRQHLSDRLIHTEVHLRIFSRRQQGHHRGHLAGGSQHHHQILAVVAECGRVQDLVRINHHITDAIKNRTVVEKSLEGRIDRGEIQAARGRLGRLFALANRLDRVQQTHETVP